MMLIKLRVNCRTAGPWTKARQMQLTQQSRDVQVTKQLSKHNVMLSNKSHETTQPEAGASIVKA